MIVLRPELASIIASMEKGMTIAGGKRVKRLVISGDHTWGRTAKACDQAKRTIAVALTWFVPGLEVIIEGGAAGVDTIAGEIADELGLTHISVPAEWDQYGTAAGPIRNKKMLTEYQPDALLYFHNNLAFSRGTKNCVDQAKELHIPVFDGVALSR